MLFRVEDVTTAYKSGLVRAVKLYPAGATTNSEFGVTDMMNIKPVLAAMSSLGMPLLVHGEVSDSSVDIFDREGVFLEHVLSPLRNEFPDLKVRKTTPLALPHLCPVYILHRLCWSTSPQRRLWLS